MKFYEETDLYRERILFITETGEHLTYQESYDLADEMLKGIPARTLAFLFCSNQPEAVSAYLGMLRRGIVPVLLDKDLPPEQIREMMKIYEPEICIYPAAEKNKMPKGHILWENAAYLTVRTGERRCQMYPELGLLLPTSGSTGSPKLVRLSYENLQSNALSIAGYLNLTKDDRPVTNLPMQYTYGLSVINSHVLKGASILLTTGTVFEERFWKLVKEQRATTLAGVPHTYEMLKRLRLDAMELPDLKVLTQAGGRLSETLQQYFASWTRKKGIKFFIMYGQTEATARMSYLPWEKNLEKPGSIGIAVPGGRLELQDEEGMVIEAPETEGELIYYGSNVSLGYAGERKDLSRGDEQRGRLATGDLAKRDAEGFYYITGRKKRFLKIFGKRISLDMLEKMLACRYPDSVAVCTGTDEKICIYIEDKSPAAPGEIAGFLSEQTRLHQSAFLVRKIPQIPRNSAGKIQYAQLLSWDIHGKSRGNS